ncbi:hypothetical protein ACG904_10260, partial [Acinetobacter guillouiae]
IYGIRSTTYPSYALNLAQLGALCISNLCATKPGESDGTDLAKLVSVQKADTPKLVKSSGY